ncbi:MAG: NAD-dependent deacylase [Elusimicrobia bacterium]|nr:NAD-dependent deacylase [Elusimicrobiota bacterium]
MAQGRKLVAGARRVAVLTGAGISAESGLATFRDSGGLWENHRVEDVATPQAFARDPVLVWEFYNARRRAGAQARPNPGHLALAALEQRKESVVIITQNVDGLHQKAGSTRVVELHGNIWRARCARCGRAAADLPVEVPFLSYCASCPGLLRPDIVWFGEALAPRDLEAAAAALQDCGLFMVVGTSAQVQPAASFAFAAVGRGVGVIEVNKEETPLSSLVSVSLRGEAGEVLPALLFV